MKKAKPKEKAATIDETGAIECLIVYKGETEDGSHIYYELPNEALNDGKKTAIELQLHRRSYNQKLFKAGSVGGIFKVKFKDETSVIFTPTQLPVAYWKNDLDRATWRALSEANKLRKQMLTKARMNMLHAYLEPIKRAYGQADYNTRNLIIAEAITFITGR